MNSDQPTSEQISSRAEVLWRARGCPSGQDTEIWLAAEAQLREESRRIFGEPTEAPKQESANRQENVSERPSKAKSSGARVRRAPPS